MKKIVVFLIVIMILALAPSLSQDKCNDKFPPIAGYSLGENSYFDMEGNLDTQKVEQIARVISKYSNAAKEYPHWIDSKKSFTLLRPFTDIWIKNTNDFYIYIHDGYEWNWTEIARIYNHNGVKLWFILFYECEGDWNPWKIAYGEKSFYTDKAELSRHQYIDAVLRAFKGKAVGYIIIYKPGMERCTPEFLADTYNYLIRKGIQVGDIEIGIQYNPRHSKFFKKLKKKLD